MANTDGLDMKITADSSGAKAELESAKKGIKEMGDAAQSANGSVQKLGSALETELGEASKKAAAAVNNVLDVIEKVAASEGFSALDDIGSKFESAFGGIFKSIAAGAVAVGGALAMVTKSALGVGGGFETQMTRVKIVSGATAEDLAKLTRKAREMGESLPISAAEAASAMELMAQRGTQAKDILVAVADVSALAISQNVGMAEASDLLGSTMSNFGIAIENASRVTDIFNNASNQSALNMEKLANGLRYVAPAASAVGMKLEEAVAAMENLANAGLSGEMIGTGLSMTLSKIASSTEILGVKTKELDGTMRPLKDIFSELQSRGMTLGEASSQFGERAAKAALNLAKYSSSLSENEQNLQTWGSTQKAVNDQLGTFENVSKGFWSAVEGVQLEVFDQIQEESKGAVGSMTELTRSFREWIGESRIASKTLQAFVSGLGFKVPSGGNFKDLLKGFDVEGFSERIKGFGRTLSDIGTGFGNLFDTVKGPLAYLISNIDAFAQLSFWGWILGKGLRIPKTLMDFGDAFGRLGTAVSAGGAWAGLSGLWSTLSTPVNWGAITAGLASLTASLSALAGISYAKFMALLPALASMAPYIAAAAAAWLYLKSVMAGNKERDEAAKVKSQASEKNLSDTELYLETAASLKTGFEDISAVIDQVGEKYKKFLATVQESKQSTFIDGLVDIIEDYNSKLPDTNQRLKITREELERWGKTAAEAMGGSVEALDKLPPGLREVIKNFIGVAMSAEKAEDATRKISEQLIGKDKTLANYLKVDISKSLGDLLTKIPEGLRQARELLSGENLELSIDVQLDDAQSRIKDFIKETAAKRLVPEDIVGLGVFQALEKLGKAGNQMAAALADGMGIAKKKVDDFAERAKDAIEYLGVDPSKFMPALQGMRKGIEKISGATGRVSEAWKTVTKQINELMNMQFDALVGRIEKLKKAVEGGFLDKSALDKQFDKALKEMTLKVVLELEPQRQNYSREEYSGVALSEIVSKMEGLMGKDSSEKAFKQLEESMKMYGGDLGRYVDELKKREEKDAKFAEANRKWMEKENQSAPQKPQAQNVPDKNTAATITAELNKLLNAGGRSTTQPAPQEAGLQNLSNLMAPLTATLQSLITRLTGAEVATGNNTMALNNLGTEIGKAQTVAGGDSGKGGKSGNTFNIAINQTGFTVQNKEDARKLANMTLDAFKTGIGNAMG